MMLTEQRLARVAELEQEAIGLGLKPDLIAMHVAAKMGIKPESATRYLRLIHEKPAPEAVAEPETPADPVEVRRHKEITKGVQSQLRDLLKRLVKAEDIRGEIMGLGAPLISKLQPDGKRPSGRRIVLQHISDIQYGEVIDYEAMDGVNSYDLDIADARIARYFKTTNRLMTELWQGKPAEKIILLLNGDMVSGALHHELDRTDALRPTEAAKTVSEQLAGGIRLQRASGFEVEVICTPGNHGRMTIKPESKGHVLQNYDTLVGMFIEMMFRGDPGVSVRYSKSVDALFTVFEFPCLVTHGDRMGSRGGQGFLGATATILRGHHKLMADYAARGIHLYKIYTGHFHTPAVTVHGFANNCMAGASEYSRDGRMTVTPASQDYQVFHEDHGVIENRQIMVGDPSEGSSHAPVLKYRRAA